MEKDTIRKGQNMSDLNMLFLEFNEYPLLKYLNWKSDMIRVCVYKVTSTIVWKTGLKEGKCGHRQII